MKRTVVTFVLALAAFMLSTEACGVTRHSATSGRRQRPNAEFT